MGKVKIFHQQGIWGTSVGSRDFRISKGLPESAYPSQLKRNDEEAVTLTFEKGELVAFNGEKDSPVNNILKLEAVAAAFAIGRDTHVGDTIVGIKGHVGFEGSSNCHYQSTPSFGKAYTV